MGFFTSKADRAVILATRTPSAKVAFHLERYQRAIDQCTNPERLPQLRCDRAFWLAVAKAQEL